MASIFIGSNRGQLDIGITNLTVGTSTGNTDIELRIDTGKGTTTTDAKLALERFIRYIQSGKFNPNDTGSV